MRYSIEFFPIGKLPILARMINNTDPIVKEFFNKNTLAEVTNIELLQLKDDHPYASILSYLYSQKLKQEDTFLFNKEIAQTALFFSNKRWLHFLLSGQGDIETMKGVHKEIADKVNGPDSNQEKNDHQNELAKSTIKDVDSTNTGMEVSQQEHSIEMAFEPYHTVDYFASMGIKLAQIDSADKLGQKVKSFTEWLKTLKKMQADDENNISTNHEITPHNNNQQQVETIVITKAMAEIYEKQGLNDKAIEVYAKLSLQNPHNSHIFVNRIKALKENRP
jgi:hypothetical protein